MAMKASLSLAAPPSSSLSFEGSARKSLLATLSSSFINGGGSFRIQHCSIALKYSRHGGALGSQMNLFDRFARVVKSYANVILSSMEDPEKILEQAVLEMNDDLTKMRQATAQVLASQKRLENKYKAAQQQSDEWYRKAQLALSKGDEELAREALKRRKSYADDAASLKSQLDQQKGVVDNLVSNTKLLESKIQEAKSKKDTLKARAQSANYGHGDASRSLNQLTSDDLEGKFAMLEASSVDDDLAKLKREISGSSLKGELPAGRATTSSSSSSPFRETEIERELNELRRKVNE